ncbi:DUF1963 domain-containing protein [Micromonospora musae]|uniref:DUF1963 domain-containing protein n=1 Tax=Micromonospora musae TaxID=1894970 RepID=UPI0018F67246|nr:DUF1963 domain-containing protein [Micromonospora musae]
MIQETTEKLNRCREKALARDIPTVDVERWLGVVRRCATLSPQANGPVVGRLGGPLMLPPDVPDPEYPLIASLDLAALPQDATDLPLPPDGQLLLFACPEASAWGSEIPLGSAAYVPVGTTVEERWLDFSDTGEEFASYQEVSELQGELRLRYDISLPDHDDIIDKAEHPHAAELREVWGQVRGEGLKVIGWDRLQIGGYATDCGMDPVTSSAVSAARTERAGLRPGTGEATHPEDWVLLAEWHPSLPGWEDAVAHWSIRRQDAAARRFNRAYVSVFWF